MKLLYLVSNTFYYFFLCAKIGCNTSDKLNLETKEDYKMLLDYCLIVTM